MHNEKKAQATTTTTTTDMINDEHVTIMTSMY